jgi:hypothetical protein
MLRLETISYLFLSLLLVWGAGWFFTHGDEIALILCCVAWAAMTVWLVLRGLRVLLRQQRHPTGATEGGSD